jgi:hypothetical protein
MVPFSLAEVEALRAVCAWQSRADVIDVAAAQAAGKRLASASGRGGRWRAAEPSVRRQPRTTTTAAAASRPSPARGYLNKSLAQTNKSRARAEATNQATQSRLPSAPAPVTAAGQRPAGGHLQGVGARVAAGMHRDDIARCFTKALAGMDDELREHISQLEVQIEELADALERRRPWR